MTYEGRGRSLGPPNLALFKLLPHIDLFILSSSETNLKFKMALEVTHRCLQGESAMADFNGSCSCVHTAVPKLLQQFPAAAEEGGRAGWDSAVRAPVLVARQRERAARGAVLPAKRSPARGASRE